MKVGGGLRECLREVRSRLDGRFLNESLDDAFREQILLSSGEVVCNAVDLEMDYACVVMGGQQLGRSGTSWIRQDERRVWSEIPGLLRVRRQRTHRSQLSIPYCSPSPLGISYHNKGTFSRIFYFASRNRSDDGCIDDLSVPLTSPNFPLSYPSYRNR